MTERERARWALTLPFSAQTPLYLCGESGPRRRWSAGRDAAGARPEADDVEEVVSDGLCEEVEEVPRVLHEEDHEHYEHGIDEAQL